MILQLIVKRRAMILMAATLSATGAFLTIATIAFLNQLAAGELAKLSDALWRGVALLILTLAAGVASNFCLARFGPGAISDLRGQLSALFLNLGYEEFSKLGHHKVTSALITDLQQLSAMIIALPMFFFNAVTLLFSLGYLFLLSWKIFAVFAGSMVIISVCSTTLWHVAGSHYRALRAEEDKLYECFNAISSGKKELSLNQARADHLLNRRIQPLIDSTQRHAELTHRWWGYSHAGSGALHLAAMLVVIYLSASLFAEPASIVTRSLVIAMFVMGPLTVVVDSGRQIGFALASVQRLRALGLEMNLPVSSPAQPAAAMPWKNIALREVEHRYDSQSSTFVFGPVNLSFSRGEVVFIVGGNGSGKSTLALLLTALLHPTSGRIEIDAEPLKRENIGAYRRLFSAVFFDFHLFADVIDRSGHTPNVQAFDRILQRLGLHDKVHLTNGRLTTLDLSQGQRRRLALAQSYIDDGDIFLFDEWAADQDPEYKRYFYLELLPELRARGKAVVVITHDDRYFHCADRIIKMEQGKIVSDRSGEPSSSSITPQHFEASLTEIESSSFKNTVTTS